MSCSRSFSTVKLSAVVVQVSQGSNCYFWSTAIKTNLMLHNCCIVEYFQNSREDKIAQYTSPLSLWATTWNEIISIWISNFQYEFRFGNGGRAFEFVPALTMQIVVLLKDVVIFMTLKAGNPDGWCCFPSNA